MRLYHNDPAATSSINTKKNTKTTNPELKTQNREIRGLEPQLEIHGSFDIIVA